MQTGFDVVRLVHRYRYSSQPRLELPNRPFDGTTNALLLDSVFEVVRGEIGNAESQERIGCLSIICIKVRFRSPGIEESRQIRAYRSLELANSFPRARRRFLFVLGLKIRQPIQNGKDRPV